MIHVEYFLQYLHPFLPLFPPSFVQSSVFKLEAEDAVLSLRDELKLRMKDLSKQMVGMSKRMEMLMDMMEDEEEEDLSSSDSDQEFSLDEDEFEIGNGIRNSNVSK